MIGLGVYFALGAVIAALARRRSHRTRARQSWLSTVLCVLLWPLWAPLVWSAAEPETQRAAQEVELAREALAEAEAVVSGTPLEALLSAEVVARILSELGQLVTRRDELRRLGRGSGHPGALVQEDRRLLDMAERDTRRLGQLLEVVRALRTRLVLARYSGASLDGVGDLLSELTTRVESLDEAFETPSPRRSLALPI